MTEDEQGEEFFLYTNRGWPATGARMKWEDQPEHAKCLWIQRMKKRSQRGITACNQYHANLAVAGGLGRDSVATTEAPSTAQADSPPAAT